MGILAYQTGATEPTMLAKGRYWIDVEDKKLPVWELWLNQAWINVKLISSEHYEETGDYPALNWFLFEVINPVEWDKVTASVLGRPTATSESTKTRDDTVQKPNPEDVLEPYGWVKWVAGGAVVVAGLFAVARIVRG